MKDKERLIKDLKSERGALEEKRNKIENFLHNNDMDAINRKLLVEQLITINNYIDVLSRRIKYLVEGVIYE